GLTYERSVGRRRRQSEKCPSGRGRRLRHCLEVDSAGAGDEARDMPQVCRLVAARGGLALQLARQQIRRIGFDHQTLGGYVAHEREQMRAAALIADPARDADREAEPQIFFELRARAGEAVRDASHERAPMLAHYRGEIRMRIALMQEYRLADPGGELQLAREGAALDIARAEVAVVIEPALAHCYDERMRGEPLELCGELIVELGGVMRVNACGRKQACRMSLRQSDCASGD